MSRIFAELRRLLRPSPVVAVTRRPAGWFVVGRRRLEVVIAWGLLEDGEVVGLVAGRGGLRPARGGFLPGAATSSRDVQVSPPSVTIPPADLEEAIGTALNPFTQDEMIHLFYKLRDASDAEWATTALTAFLADPDRFLRRHFELIAEHGRPAELDEGWRAGLAALTRSRSNRPASTGQGDRP